MPQVVRDWMDELRAIQLREWHGRRGGLLSWHPEPAGGWRSRLSSPGLVYTIERVGATRVEAIERSLDARDRTLNLRAAIRFDRMLAATPDDSD